MPKNKRSSKDAALSLAAFHQQNGGTPVDPEGERLPEGPEETAAADEGARKVWIAEWGGRPELMSGDALAVVTSAPGSSVATID